MVLTLLFFLLTARKLRPFFSIVWRLETVRNVCSPANPVLDNYRPSPLAQERTSELSEHKSFALLNEYIARL